VQCKPLFNPGVEHRADLAFIIDSGTKKKGIFDNEFINLCLFLENIYVKESHEKDNFLK